MKLGNLLILGIVFCGSASAQLLHPASPMPAFAVVSVRPTQPDEELSRGSITPDSYRATRTTLGEVLSYAFGLGYDRELASVPPWVKSEHFDIQGKLDDAQVAERRTLNRKDSETQMRLMVQSMLAQRFQLAYHFEMRTLPIYALEVAKDGIKCPVDTTSPPAIRDPSRPPFRWSAVPAPPPPPPDWRPPSPSEQNVLQQSLHLRTKGWPFWLIVTTLSHQPELDGRPVIDKTGLDGSYDCEMKWSQAGSEGDGQSLFSAIRDQLGLKLQPSTGPVEVLIVDSIQKPTEN